MGLPDPKSTVISNPDPVDHSGFILAEEEGLKRYLAGLKVPTTTRGGTVIEEVPVYYRFASSERRIEYPYITIDLLNVFPDFQRLYSVINEWGMPSRYEWGHQQYAGDGYYYPDQFKVDDPADEGMVASTGNFMAYKLRFQITVWSRNITHDRILMSHVFSDLFRVGGFFVPTEPDGVWHRCFLEEWVQGDTIESIEATKRILRKIYTISMDTEMPATRVQQISKVRKIHVDLYEKYLMDEGQVLGPHADDSPLHDDMTVAHWTHTGQPDGTVDTT